MAFVLDALIVGCWLFEDESNARAIAAWSRLESEYALVPLHWWFEVRNICLLGERRGRATEDSTLKFLDDLQRLTIDFDGIPDQLPVIALARKHRLTSYDAAYLELAQREGLALATLDEHLARAARAEGVPLVTG